MVPVVCLPLVSWARRFGGGLEEVALDIAVSASGSAILLAGTFKAASWSIGKSTLTNTGATSTTDVWVARLNSTGASV